MLALIRFQYKQTIHQLEDMKLCNLFTIALLKLDLEVLTIFENWLTYDVRGLLVNFIISFFLR